MGWSENNRKSFFQWLFGGSELAPRVNLGDSDSGTSLDPFGAPVFIDFEHHEIHEGDTYDTSYLLAVLANAGNLDLLLVTPAAILPHVVFSATCGGDADLLLYEATVTTNDGTPLPRRNKRRDSGKTAQVTSFHTPTVAGGSEGTLLFSVFLPGGEKNQASGGSASSRSEWILKSSTKYLLRLTNRAGAGKRASINAEWYEEDA